MAAPKLTYAFTLKGSGVADFDVKSSNATNLTVDPVYGGSVSTPDGRIVATQVEGQDWMTVTASTGTINVDARLMAKGPNGVNFDFSYTGKVHMGEEAKALFSGKSRTLEWHQGYYYTLMHISSRSEEFAWVNEAVFVAMGRLELSDDGRVHVTYKIFKVEAPSAQLS